MRWCVYCKKWYHVNCMVEDGPIDKKINDEPILDAQNDGEDEETLQSIEAWELIDYVPVARIPHTDPEAGHQDVPHTIEDILRKLRLAKIEFQRDGHSAMPNFFRYLKWIVTYEDPRVMGDKLRLIIEVRNILADTYQAFGYDCAGLRCDAVI